VTAEFAERRRRSASGGAVAATVFAVLLAGGCSSSGPSSVWSSSGASSGSASGDAATASASGAPVTDALPVAPDAVIAAEEAFLASLIQPSGVVPTRPVPDEDGGGFRVMPYFSHLAMAALLQRPGHVEQVKTWLTWNMAHINRPDAQHMTGTVYDYTIKDGVLEPTLDYDSVDSYAGTFVSLLLTYWQHGGDHAFVRKHHDDIATIANVMMLSQADDHLSWAKPNYPVKYLMDNSELYRGLADAATLWQLAWPAETEAAAGWRTAAEQTRQALFTIMGNGDSWVVDLDQWGKKSPMVATRWYADVTSQMYPVIFGVIPTTDPRAVNAWATLNSSFPKWAELQTGDDYPWAMIGYAASLMGDRAHADQFNRSVYAKYISTGHPQLWYSLEAAMTLRMNLWLRDHPAIPSATGATP
jgi:hypothetical protein